MRKSAVLALLALALVSCAPAADAARRAFLGDLEPQSDGLQARTGRRLQEAEPVVDILATADYAVLDVLAADYDSSIGPYGGLAVYGYYGSFTGVYGSYGGSLFVDYETIIDEDVLISAEVPREELAPPRRELLEDDPMVVLPVLAEEYASDYAVLETPGSYGFYGGFGRGIYYGGFPVYGGYGGYGGDVGPMLDYEGVEQWNLLTQEVDGLLIDAVSEAAAEDLLENIAEEMPFNVIPK